MWPRKQDPGSELRGIRTDPGVMSRVGGSTPQSHTRQSYPPSLIRRRLNKYAASSASSASGFDAASQQYLTSVDAASQEYLPSSGFCQDSVNAHCVSL
jgi:hypothetical protein